MSKEEMIDVITGLVSEEVRIGKLWEKAKHDQIIKLREIELLAEKKLSEAEAEAKKRLDKYRAQREKDIAKELEAATNRTTKALKKLAPPEKVHSKVEKVLFG